MIIDSVIYTLYYVKLNSSKAYHIYDNKSIKLRVKFGETPGVKDAPTPGVEENFSINFNGSGRYKKSIKTDIII